MIVPEVRDKLLDAWGIDAGVRVGEFSGEQSAYEAIGYTILLPASAVPGWPADVVLPSNPVWKRDYSGSVRRLIRDGVDLPLASLFVHVARAMREDAEGAARARSATEATRA